MNILYRSMIDFIALIKHFPFLTYRYESLGVGFWTWGLELFFLELKILVDGVWACGMEPFGFSGGGALNINIEEHPWE